MGFRESLILGIMVTVIGAIIIYSGKVVFEKIQSKIKEYKLKKQLKLNEGILHSSKLIFYAEGIELPLEEDDSYSCSITIKKNRLDKGTRQR